VRSSETTPSTAAAPAWPAPAAAVSRGRSSASGRLPMAVDLSSQLHHGPQRSPRSRSHRQLLCYGRLSLLAKLALVRSLKYHQEKAPVSRGPSPRTHAQPARVSRVSACPRPSAQRRRGGAPTRQSPPMQARQCCLSWRRVGPRPLPETRGCPSLPEGSPGNGLPRPRRGGSGETPTSV